MARLRLLNSYQFKKKTVSKSNINPSGKPVENLKKSEGVMPEKIKDSQ